MNNQQLKEQMEQNRKEFINKLVDLLYEDPDWDGTGIHWKETLKNEYLPELYDKGKSLVDSITIALEYYLEK